MNRMFEHDVAARMGLLKTESAFAVLKRANELEAAGKSVVHMEIGQPDFSTPAHIIEAAHQAMKDGFTGYSPTAGYPQTREAIAQYAAAFKGIKTSANEVVVVPGGKPIMFFTMLALVEEGDEVIYPNPSFPIYDSVIRFSGATPVPLKLSAQDDFRLNLEELERLITPKTKLLILNSPSNPTGGLYTHEDVYGLAEILKKHPKIFILSDEIYDRLIYEGSALSIATIPELKDRTIILDGFSKTFAMTGWRLGYGIMHPDIAKHIEMLMVNSNSCAASFSQIAAIAALQGPQDCVDEMRSAFKDRRDYLVGALNAIDGVTCTLPKGAFYTFPDISSFGVPCAVFADRLLEEAGVASTSGVAFGAFGEGYIRLSYATSMDNIKIAVDRLRDFTKKL
jgi:aspartate/methionine/tyrosine aminotransferase